MRSVLLLAYYFPPLGGGGVQRSLAFTRHLPGFGYRPVVVTGPAAGAVQWGPVDGTLADRVPEGTDVVRIDGPEPARTVGWRCRAERWLRVEEPFSRWWVDGAVESARDRAGAVDVVYASMSPFETGRAAARIAAEAGKPWVADLRDPWALDDWLVFPTGLHRRLELWTMRRTLSTAAAIVMNTPEATEQLLRHAPELGDRPVLTIPNGFDPEDFEAALPAHDPAVFRIVHAGHVHTGRETQHDPPRPARARAGPLAASTRRRGRTSTSCEPLELLLERRPDLRGRIEVELVGPLSDADRSSFPDYVFSRGYLSHGETIELPALRRSPVPADARPGGPGCAPASFPARRTSTSPRARRSSAPFPPATRASSWRRPATRTSARPPTPGP